VRSGGSGQHGEKGLQTLSQWKKKKKLGMMVHAVIPATVGNFK
jgi:hypothetical protein